MVKLAFAGICVVAMSTAWLTTTPVSLGGQATVDQQKKDKKADAQKKTDDKKADEKKNADKADDKKAKVKTLTEVNRYAKVDLSGGEKLIVTLPCNPSTGYTWVLGSKDDPRFHLDGKPVYTPDDAKLIGGGGTMTFTFLALSAGDVEVELQYRRPFEKGRDPEKTFSFTARIK